MAKDCLPEIVRHNMWPGLSKKGPESTIPVAGSFFGPTLQPGENRKSRDGR